MDVVEALVEALSSFQGLVRSDATADAWDSQSTLPDYTVGGLVNHVVMGVGWLAKVARQPAAPAEMRVVAPGGYFAAMKREPDTPADEFHGALVKMGNEAAGRGWSATSGYLPKLGDEVVTNIPGGDLDRTVDLNPTLPFATSLRTFVATRVVELVVHGDDLAVSVGIDGLMPGPSAFRVCADMLTDTAAVQHDRLAVLRALSRRERALPGTLPVF